MKGMERGLEIQPLQLTPTGDVKSILKMKNKGPFPCTSNVMHGLQNKRYFSQGNFVDLRYRAPFPQTNSMEFEIRATPSVLGEVFLLHKTKYLPICYKKG